MVRRSTPDLGQCDLVSFQGVSVLGLSVNYVGWISTGNISTRSPLSIMAPYLLHCGFGQLSKLSHCCYRVQAFLLLVSLSYQVICIDQFQLKVLSKWLRYLMQFTSVVSLGTKYVVCLLLIATLSGTFCCYFYHCKRKIAPSLYIWFTAVSWNDGSCS